MSKTIIEVACPNCMVLNKKTLTYKYQLHFECKTKRCKEILFSFTFYDKISSIQFKTNEKYYIFHIGSPYIPSVIYGLSEKSFNDVIWDYDTRLYFSQDPYEFTKECMLFVENEHLL